LKYTINSLIFCYREVKYEPVESQAQYFYKAALSIDHPCIHCGDNFVNQISLISHQIYERFCVECKTTFKDLDMFQQHRMYAHVSLEFCTFCRQLMTSRSKLIQHLRSHTSLPLRAADSIKGYVYRCRNCKEVFKVKQEYDKHNIENHFVGKKICPFCLEIFGTHREMAVHSKVHCNVKKHTLQPKPVKAAPKTIKSPQKAASIPQKAAKAPQKPPKILSKTEKSSSQSRSGPLEKKSTEKSKKPAPAKDTPKVKKSDSPALTKKTDSPALTKKSVAASDAASVASSKTVVSTFKPITMKGNRCSACRESVSSLKAFYEHVLKLHFDNPLHCPFCEKKTKLAFHMKSHLRQHENVFCAPEPSQSADCTDSSSDIASNAQPKLSTKSATTQQSLKDVDAGSQTNKCPLCSMTFKSQALLNGHIRTSHRLEPAK
jgi:Zinc finger, C2H2 type